MKLIYLQFASRGWLMEGNTFTTTPQGASLEREVIDPKKQARQELSQCIDDSIRIGDLDQASQDIVGEARRNFFTAVHEYCGVVNMKEMDLRLKFAIALDEGIKNGVNILAGTSDVLDIIIGSELARSEEYIKSISPEVIGEFYEKKVQAQEPEAKGRKKRSWGKRILAGIGAAALTAGLALGAYKWLSDSDSEKVHNAPEATSESNKNTRAGDENITTTTTTEPENSNVTTTIPEDTQQPNADNDGLPTDTNEEGSDAVDEPKEPKDPEPEQQFNDTQDDNEEEATEQLTMTISKGSYVWKELNSLLPEDMPYHEKIKRISASLPIIAEHNGRESVKDLDLVFVGENIAVPAEALDKLGIRETPETPEFLS